MKKIVSLLVTIMLIVSALTSMVLIVKAHPGRTDSNGGHTDHSTGEYHYHHGYPAHDHYDMDGDGIIDCPYDFDDQTGKNSGSKSGKSRDTSSGSDLSSSAPSQNEEEIIVPSWIYWVFFTQAIICIILIFSNGSKRKTIERMINEHRDEMNILQKTCEEKIAEKNATDAELEQTRRYIVGAKQELDDLLGRIRIETRNLTTIRQLKLPYKEAPLDVTFSENGMPVYWKPSMDKPYGDYTVFVSPKSDIYHVDRVCGGYRGREDHIFNVISHARPCKKCAAGFFDFATIPDWFSSEQDKQMSIYDDDSLKINFRNQ